MYIKKKRQRNGRRRERSYERLAFEAGLDYLLSMIRLPHCTRARYAKYLAERGFDITSQDLRPQPAPKPCIVHNTSEEDQHRGKGLGREAEARAAATG